MTPSLTTTGLTREQFLVGVRTSGVLTDRQFDKVTGALTVFQKSAREVADFLVTGGWLTPFQAERLLHGKADGFLLGPYVVQDYLAKTASGRVYKAKHRTMNRAVAVLVLKQEVTTSEGVREAIRAQARSAARLAHPNLLTLLDVNTAGERMYLVSEYIDGGDVAAVVRKGGPLSVPRACEFVRQAALGLQHAHEKETTHGRLSPAALLVGRPGGNGPEDKPVVKVIGLGLGDLAGTEQPLEYAAPERVAPPKPTVSADVFALGGVLHFLLTGRPPNPAAPLPTVRGDLPPPLLAVVEAMLAADPARRPASAADVANSLTPFVTDDSAFIDFTLPAGSGTHSSPVLSGRHLALPVGIPISVTPPPLPATPRSPFADLGVTDAGDDESGDTPVSGHALYTPVHTVRRTRTTSRRGTRRSDQNVSLWLGVVGAVVVLAMAGGALALLAAVVRS